MNTPINHRPLSDIAREISTEWRPLYFGARPYLCAMYSLTKITDVYGYDSADSIVRYFLANAGTWRGDKARTIKSELKEILKLRSECQK